MSSFLSVRYFLQEQKDVRGQLRHKLVDAQRAVRCVEEEVRVADTIVAALESVVAQEDSDHD